MKRIIVFLALVFLIGCSVKDEKYDTIEHTIGTYEEALQTRNKDLFLETLYFPNGTEGLLNDTEQVSALMGSLTEEQASKFDIEVWAEDVYGDGELANVTIKLWTFNQSGTSKIRMNKVEGLWKINVLNFIE